MEVFGENQDLRHLVDTELFAKLFFPEAVNSADFNDAIQLLGYRHVFIFKLLAFLKLGIEEVNDPYFLTSIKLEDTTEVKPYHIGFLEEIRNHFLSLLLMPMATLLKAETTSAKEVGKHIIHVHVAEVTSASLAFALLMLTDTLFALLVVDSALVRIRKGFICVGNLLELFLCCFWVILILVRVILDSKLFEGLFDFIISCITLHVEQLIIVFPCWCLISLLLLLVVVLSLTTTLLVVIMVLRRSKSSA